MLRVDHAGEYGATRIYAGQLAVLRGSSRAAHLVTHMAAQEDRHLARFEQLLTERRVRPTLLQPLWHIGGFALGAATALISEKAAMACTDAVETEIDRHYEEQLQELGVSSRRRSWNIATPRGSMARWRRPDIPC
jgi:ubiquinone biosynthesis monooxygenase Coq7